MNLLEEIRQKFRASQCEYSLHAVDQSIQRRITTKEVEQAIATGEIIEDYPSDKYGPSCLILGSTAAGRYLHVQCTHSIPARVKVITLYEPDPNEWVDRRFRRRK